MAALPHGLTLAASSLGNKWAVPALLDDASLVDAVAALQLLRPGPLAAAVRAGARAGVNTVLAAATAELRDRCGYADADSAHAGAAVHWALVWERDGARVSLPLAKRGCTCASSVAAECQLREFWCPDCVGARVRLCGFRPSDSAAVRLPLTAVDVAWAGGEDAVVTLLSAAAERRQDETFSAVVVNSYKCCAHPMVLLAKGGARCWVWRRGAQRLSRRTAAAGSA